MPRRITPTAPSPSKYWPYSHEPEPCSSVTHALFTRPKQKKFCSLEFPKQGRWFRKWKPYSFRTALPQNPPHRCKTAAVGRYRSRKQMSSALLRFQQTIASPSDPELLATSIEVSPQPFAITENGNLVYRDRALGCRRSSRLQQPAYRNSPLL